MSFVHNLKDGPTVGLVAGIVSFGAALGMVPYPLAFYRTQISS
jgi:hypothetical protein